MHVETTPVTITPPILRFCEKLCPGREPGFVPVMPLPLPWASMHECYFNVADMVRQEGGEAQYGWLIWEWPGVMLHAEFHCVWRTEGGLLDITPLPDGEESILFLPHPTKTYEGFPVVSERVALVNDKQVRKFVAAHQEMERLRVSTITEPLTKRAGPVAFPLYRLSSEDTEQYQQMEALATRLQAKMLSRSKRSVRGRASRGRARKR
jgi:hypothetical protein